MERKDVMFVGIFVPEIQRGTLENCNNKGGQHITIAYRPSQEAWEKLLPYIGQEVEVIVNSYGNDGQNEGLGVEIDESIPYFGATQKHVTLSIAEGAYAVNTGKIEMKPITPYVVVGRIGAIDFKGVIHY